MKHLALLPLLALFLAVPAVAQTCDEENALSRFGLSLSDAAAASCAEGSGAVDSLSFGELAAARVPALFEKVIDELAILDDETPPHEPQVKALRKSIQKLRDHVDLFAAAYPETDGGNGDPWKALRGDLDDGYEAIGRFKDLFDSQGLTLAEKDPETGEWSEGIKPKKVEYPDTKDVKKLRKDALEWAENFTKTMRLDRYRSLLTCPDPSPAYGHEKEDLSKFFWGGVDVKPDADLGGLANMSRLADALLDEAGKEYDAVKKLDTPRGTKKEEQFHDFRKRIRSLGNVLNNFPEISAPETEATRAILTDAVSRYGAIEDQLVAWHAAQDAGKDKKARKLAEAIDEAWDELDAWQTEQHLGRVIDSLREQLALTALFLSSRVVSTLHCSYDWTGGRSSLRMGREEEHFEHPEARRFVQGGADRFFRRQRIVGL